MKNIFFVLLLSILFSANAYADPTKFKCINKDGTEREYILSIDLKKEEIKRAGIIYKIIIIDEDVIAAENENAQYSNLMNFFRYSGDMRLQIRRKNPVEGQTSLKEEVSYSCKLMKKLI